MDLPITYAQMNLYACGAMIQDAFPDLTADEREFLKSGITAEEWNQTFPEEEPKQTTPEPEKEEKWPTLGTIPLDLQEALAANNDGVPVQTEPEYRPPSSKVYQIIGVRGYKFHKLRPVLKYLNQNIYLAGGALRTLLKCSGEQVSDFDFFFKTFEEVQKLRDRLEEDGWEISYECPLGFLYTYKKGNHKLQLICETEYETAESLILSFDVSACMCCWHDGILTFTREFVRSVKTKQLRTCNVSFPVATIKRLIKYAQKGYNVSLAAEDFCRQVSGATFVGDQFRHYID